MLSRLQRLHAKALGLYMARRLQGETAEVQKRRLRQIEKLMETTDSTD